ncbi:N4-gp56 family major capsid protein [Moraxella catarrhalis]|uniref:N4-gp56 family major capsid protein n=1 Tax=Moraxella catarrhalis TaxID=480 RepID=UPI00128E515A|nr:N4-gp56 family major capsid protein [Moraxella catarrhalis]MPY08782.1 N4-gp56 family major capsid protein [Moraxella catarrhalis]
MTIVYNNGTNPSTVGATQLNPHVFERKALLDSLEEAYFGQLADSRTMPKNSGTVIKQYRYFPVIDDRNSNEMGLDAKGAKYAHGNLYGSSNDAGLIADKFPVLGELGGRKNRIGMTRKEIQSNLQKFGVFYEYSNDAVNFDSDAKLLEHLERETTNACMTIYEDKLQLDLLTNAGLVKYAGTATQNSELSHGMELNYADLVKLGIDLDKNRCPKQTKIITGTQLTDTRTIPDCRIAYVGSELIPTLEAMVDYHNKPAFIPAHQYAAGTTLLKGEVGRIAGFRIIVVPRMMKWAGVGANATNAAYYKTGSKYDVFPFLVVGDEAFTTIGFQSGGGSGKFTTIHKKAGEATASSADPYGETGFTSKKWWYGFMPQYVERIALLKVVAKM